MTWKCPACGRVFSRQDQHHFCEKPQTVSAYIEAQDAAVQPMLREIRAVIRSAVPDAEERISWSMPTYWKGRNLIHFAAFRQHIGLYPGGEATAVFAKELEGFSVSKGTIRLPYTKELPAELIAKIAKWCYAHNGKSPSGEKFMEKLYFEIPGIERKDDAVDYIREFREHQSAINGTGGLDRFTDNYEGWLEKLEQDYTREPTEEKVPARTFFLVRESDRRIVGMINIRLCLNERLSRYGGHMGYSIRPTERGKGYNKINLYLGLKVCRAHGIDKVFLDADLDNPASWKTMEALGGVRIRKYYDDVYAHCTVVDYNIDVRKALEEHSGLEEMVSPASDPVGSGQ